MKTQAKRKAPAEKPGTMARQVVRLIKQWDQVLADLDRTKRKVMAYRNLLSHRLADLATCARCGYPMSAQEYLAGFREHDQCARNREHDQYARKKKLPRDPIPFRRREGG